VLHVHVQHGATRIAPPSGQRQLAGLAVDAARPTAVPRIVTLQGDVNDFHGRAGRKLAFTSQSEAPGPGLYVADAIP
jgi:hypothetical protein